MARWDAADYAKNSANQARWALELIDRIPWRGDEWALDVGCGDGKVTAELAKRVMHGRVVGIDQSEEMVRFARDAFTGVGNLEFRQMDAAAIDLPERFDLVFSNAALHWVQDQRGFVLGTAKAMKPGARLITSSGGRGNAQGIYAALRQVTARPQWRQFFEPEPAPAPAQTYWFLGPEEYRPWLAEAGLRVVRLELVRKDMVHPGRAGLAGWIRTTWLPYTQRIGEDQRERFIDDVVAEYVGQFPADPAGGLHVEMVRLEVEAVRV